MYRFATLIGLLVLGPSLQAQTVETFGAVLRGTNEVPPNGSPARGIVAVAFVDNPSPNPDLLLVDGGFDDLTAPYTASHIHRGPAGSNGPIVQGLNAILEPGNRSGSWDRSANTYLNPRPSFVDSLRNGLAYVNVHTTAFPGGEIRGQLVRIPNVDGNLSDTQYIPLATKLNTNMGFGPNIDVTQIVYYPELTHGALFIGLKGKLNTASSDGIGLWLDFSEVTGEAAGTDLGGVPNAGHYMGNTGNNGYDADFEVDYMFAINPGGGSSSVFFDASKLVGTNTSDFLGSTDQAGTPELGPTDSLDNNGNPAFFRRPSVAFAFNNAGAPQTGFEFAIPFSELGLTPAQAERIFRRGGGGTFQAFAFVVSSSAYFSNVTVPGNVTAGNLGFNPSFSANLTAPNCACPSPSSTIGQGPYHSPSGGIPVELTAFDAAVSGEDVTLRWATASETNNSGFEVQMRRAGDAYEPVAFVPGHGTTTEAQTYTHTLAGLAPGAYTFRLKQVDFDGTTAYSPEVEATVGVPGAYALSAAYPNPFNPTAQFSLSVARTQRVRVALYDALGREVRVLFDGPVEGGEARTFTIEGDGLPSGLYVYRVVGERFSDAGRVTLLK